jgi:flavodoxin
VAKNYKSLLVYFSRTGNTKKVAETVADILSCDQVEEVTESQGRAGALGYLRSIWEAATGAAPVIDSPLNDPSHYDVVIVASPVWMSRLSSPIRTYLLKEGEKLPRVAFVVTEGGSGGNRVLLQMRDMCHKIPLSEVVITEDDILKGSHLKKIRSFAEKLQKQFEKDSGTVAVSPRKVVP